MSCNTCDTPTNSTTACNNCGDKRSSVSRLDLYACKDECTIKGTLDGSPIAPLNMSVFKDCLSKGYRLKWDAETCELVLESDGCDSIPDRVSVSQMMRCMEFCNLKDVTCKDPKKCQMFVYDEATGGVKNYVVPEVDEDDVAMEAGFDEDDCLVKYKKKCVPDSMLVELDADCMRDPDTGAYSGPADATDGNFGRAWIVDCEYKNNLDCPVCIEVVWNADLCLIVTPGAQDVEIWAGIRPKGGGTVKGVASIDVAGQTINAVKLAHVDYSIAKDVLTIPAPSISFPVEVPAGTDFEFELVHFYKDNNGTVQSFASTSGFAESGIQTFPSPGYVRVIEVKES